MRIAVAIVDPEGFRKAECNDTRRAWARAALDHLAACPGDATVLVLPAGFLAAPSDEVLAVAAPVMKDAADRDIEMILGVDEVDRDSESAMPTGGEARPGNAPEGCHLGFAAVASGWQGRCYWQRSVTGADGRELPVAIAQEARSVLLGRDRVEVLLCGEVFAPAIREGVLGRAPRIVVVLAHTAHGSRHGHGIARLALAPSSSLTVLRAVHAVGDARTWWPSHRDAGRSPRRVKVSETIWLDVTEFTTAS